ncbi:zinc-dependent alcohol dehydrogenase family protein, partial [Singulisphaera rosea]
MKAIVFDRFGEPGDVLQVREQPIPEPGPGEVRVRMIASPVNPSDLLVVRGLYGVLPTLPATPGFEGVGVVDKAGRGLLGWLAKGKRVTVINHKGGNWAEYAVIPARQARPVPSDIPDEQVASFFVNPATVLAMVRHILAVPKGAWLLQSAAGSVLGKMIIRLGQHDGFRTINVVRRHEAIAELKALGADVVLSTSDGPIETQVRNVVGPAGVAYAIDPVGGET